MRVSGASDLIDLEMHLHHATERAVLVSDDGDKAKAVWLPLSQVEVAPRTGATVTVTCPEWLAIEKGLA